MVKVVQRPSKGLKGEEGEKRATAFAPFDSQTKRILGMVNPEMYWAERREDNEPEPSWRARQRRCTYSKERLQSGCVLYQMAPSVARHPGGTGMTKDLTQS